jgi:hypothetical protein
MTNDDIENCTFEPNAGGLSTNPFLFGLEGEETTDPDVRNFSENYQGFLCWTW